MGHVEGDSATRSLAHPQDHMFRWTTVMSCALMIEDMSQIPVTSLTDDAQAKMLCSLARTAGIDGCRIFETHLISNTPTGDCCALCRVSRRQRWIYSTPLCHRG